MKMKGNTCELRPLENDDAERFSDFLNEGLNFNFTFTGSIPMRPIDVEKEWDAERQRKSAMWGIFVPAAGCSGIDFIGTTGLYGPRDIYRSWEFRILIGRPGDLGHGIGTEATRMVVDWGFKRLNAHRIWLGVNAENERAVKCYRKVGFREEGRLRDEIFCHGKYADAIRMGILESEWLSTATSS